MFETTRPAQNKRKSRSTSAASIEVRPGSAVAASSSASVSSSGAIPFFTCESAWESNPPRRVLRPVNGFEDRGHHRMPRTLMCVCERIRGRVYVEGRGRDQQEAHVTHGRGTSRDKELVKERKAVASKEEEASARAGPLAQALVRDARGLQARQGRLLLPRRAEVQEQVRDVRLQRRGEPRRRKR